MTIDTSTPADVMVRMQEAVEKAAKGIRDPQDMRKAREEMNRLREELRQRIGTVDIAVDLIRDGAQPMKFVVDASVGLKWVLPEAGSGKAIQLQEDFENAIHELIAPDTFPVEVAHALTHAERRGILQRPEAVTRFSWVLTTLPGIHLSLPLLPRAIEISSQYRVGVYDCLYVALAEQERCALVTADDRLLKSMQGFRLVSLGSI